MSPSPYNRFISPIGFNKDGSFNSVSRKIVPPYANEQVPGLIEKGNIELWDRPVLKNPDGSWSTTSSMSFGTPKGEVLIPTVVNGRRLTEDEAKAHYYDTGEHLGIFKTPEFADQYAVALHNAQANAGNKPK